MLNINKNNLNFGLNTIIKYNCLCQYMRFYYLHPPLYMYMLSAKLHINPIFSIAMSQFSLNLSQFWSISTPSIVTKLVPTSQFSVPGSINWVWFLPNPQGAKSAIQNTKIRQYISHKGIILYIEYQSVCPSVRIGSPPPCPASECVPPPHLEPKGGGGPTLAYR